MSVISAVSARRAAMLATVASLSAAAAVADPGHASGIGHPARPGKSTRTVAVTLDDNYYVPDRVTVKPGETVRFVLTNHGTIDHEFTLGTPAMHAEHRKMMLTMRQQGGHAEQGAHGSHGGHGGTMHHDDPGAVMLGPGETRELVWMFGKATTLEFACNIPTHYETGMVGKVEFRR